MSEMAKNLHLAVHRNDHATLAQLLKSASSSDVNHQHNHPTEKTAHLIVAIKKRHVECVRLLLAYPYINVNLANSPGMTALHMAAEEGLADIAKSLIVDHRADVNAKNFTGMTPLVYAAQKGYTALIFAAMVSNGWKDYKDGHYECVKMLLADARVDVSIKCKRGHPALTYGYNSIVKSLISGKRVFGSYPVPEPAPVPVLPPPPAVKAAPVVPVVPVVPVAWAPAEPRSTLPAAASSASSNVASSVAPAVPHAPAQSTQPPAGPTQSKPEPVSVVVTDKIVREDDNIQTAQKNVQNGVQEMSTNNDDPVYSPEADTTTESASIQSDTVASAAFSTSLVGTNSATFASTTPPNSTNKAVPSTAPDPSAKTASATSSWLAPILLNEGFAPEIVQDCEQRLVTGEGFLREQDFATLDVSDFNRVYLKQIGIVGLGIQSRLLALQQELCVKYAHSGAHKDGAADEVQVELDKLRVQCEAQRQLLEDTGIFDPVYCD
eukprot:gene15611-17842_t